MSMERLRVYNKSVLSQLEIELGDPRNDSNSIIRLFAQIIYSDGKIETIFIIENKLTYECN